MPKADRPARRTQIETLEERVVMSADPLGGLLGGAISQHGAIDAGSPVEQHAPPLSQHNAPLSHHGFGGPDFWLDETPDPIETLDGLIGDIEQTLQSAHNQTGLNNVRNDYGFRGGGQTVAVIDSGIAYDHYALGGGFGSNYRVVGGWDFTGENDANPYDDGPEGSHGTHVAGIIGSSDSTHQGVAPDVDLVGLRVFDDAGAGYFSWVENALQWVIDNRTAFENPITAVNLSLGTNWNSATVPNWAMLEEEFAQLEADGVFISVSAGNSFTSYNTPGLSYPAASPYVVPVMSTDDSGLLSYFSQRHQSAIAAPGRWIYSTIPDYAGNNNGVTDDWANFSGTSMAAPYVAGASVIVREAMEFVGMTNINQDTIYAHMLATADTINDAATGLSYSRLNLEAAIDALMPTDDYGSSEASAYSLGSISGSLSTASLMNMNGVISTLDDSDYFTFTAATTGTVTFTAQNTTHNLDASWQGFGGQGWSDATGNVYTMNVVAGQQYTVALSTDDGLGYYSLSVTAEAAFTYTDWGTTTGQQTQTGLTAGSAAWYRIVTGQNGFLTAEALINNGTADIALYDTSLNLIQGSDINDRLDYYATAGSEFYIRILGASSSLDVRLTNLVNQSGSTVTVGGTSGADAFFFTAGAATHALAVNGVSYTFAASGYNTFNFNGGAGSDSITMTGTAGDETLVARAGAATLTASGFSVATTSIEDATVHSVGGSDRAFFYDTAGHEEHKTWRDRTVIIGSGFKNDARGFSWTRAFSTGGGDKAYLYDTTGAENYHAWSDRAVMVGSDFTNDTRGFAWTRAFSTGGGDKAYLYDTTGAENYHAWSDRAVMVGGDFTNDTRGFAWTRAFSTGGGDKAYLYDTTGAENYHAWSDRAVMVGSGFTNDTRGFAWTRAFSTGGGDKAYLYDTTGAENYHAWSDRAVMVGSGFTNDTRGFAWTRAFSTGGGDKAYLYDTTGAENYHAWSDRAVMVGSDFTNDTRGFAWTRAFSTGGGDKAYLYDTTGAENYHAWSDRAVMVGSGFTNDTRGFAWTRAFSTGGGDKAYLYDTTGAENYHAWSDRAVMVGSGFTNDTRGFAWTRAFSTGGGDKAYLYDTTGAENYHAWSDRAVMVGSGFTNDTRGFAWTRAFSTGGGDKAYLYDTAGDETVSAWSDRAVMVGNGFTNDTRGFAAVFANATAGNDRILFYDSDADEQLGVMDWGAYVDGPNYRREAKGFDRVTAIGGGAGSDDVSTETIDYAFEEVGDWKA